MAIKTSVTKCHRRKRKMSRVVV